MLFQLSQKFSEIVYFLWNIFCKISQFYCITFSATIVHRKYFVKFTCHSFDICILGLFKLYQFLDIFWNFLLLRKHFLQDFLFNCDRLSAKIAHRKFVVKFTYQDFYICILTLFQLSQKFSVKYFDSVWFFLLFRHYFL